MKFDDQEEWEKITKEYKEKVKNLEKKKQEAIKNNPEFTIKPTLKGLTDKWSKTTLEVRLDEDDADMLWKKRSLITRFSVTFSERVDDQK